jgi:hypothetical protein
VAVARGYFGDVIAVQTFSKPHIMRIHTSLLLTAIIASFIATAQPAKWFVSVATGYTMGGPAASIKNNMRRCNLDHISSFSALWGLFSGTTNYPESSRNLPLLLKAGKRLTDKRSLYLVVGISGTGSVEGFRKIAFDESWDDFFSKSVGIHVHVEYKLYQISAGYQYSYPNTHAKIAVAPSLFLFRYQNTSASTLQRHTAVAPGVAFTSRLPLGKEKRLIGVDLLVELNLAPPVKMQALTTEYTYGDKTSTATLQRSNVNLVHGMLGLALSLRR